MPSGEYTNDSVTLVPGFLRGFRAWSIAAPSPLQLRGVVNTEYAWGRGQNTAMCRAPHGAGWTGALRPIVRGVPDPDCSCGFYARFDPGRGYVGIQGIIKVTGNVILGTEGFRAQYATIEALYQLDQAARERYEHILERYVQPRWLFSAYTATEAIAEHYGVPVFSSAAEAEYHFPIPSTEGLVEEVEQRQPASLGDQSPHSGYRLPAPVKPGNYHYPRPAQSWWPWPKRRVQWEPTKLNPPKPFPFPRRFK